MDEQPVLVIGASGYVGGRLVPLLLEAGYRVRAAARSVEKLLCRRWASHPSVEIVSADVLAPGSLHSALMGCSVAYYLVHSMDDESEDFAATDRRAARNMADAADAAGLERIIYLGGLGDPETTPSRHLRSRHEVAEILRTGPVPVTYLRAGVILGSGSAGFEILRYLVDRLPVMITPRWVRTPCQPIAVRNVLQYLVGCLEHGETVGETFDIGGEDVLTYRALMEMYAEVAKLRKRMVIPVPVLTPTLSSYWIHLVTPVHASIARPLAAGLSTPALCTETRIRSICPVKLLGCREAITIALDQMVRGRVETRWADAGGSDRPEWVQHGDASYAGGTLLDSSHRVLLRAEPEDIWQPIAEIGGDRGWYFGDRLWRLRGWLDLLAGGSGLRRGRRHPRSIYPGEPLDFWRVAEVDPPRRLLLHAEMKMPGEATLELRIIERGEGRAELQQISRFLPRGLAGILYWYGLYPVHGWLFQGMLRSIAARIGQPILRGPEPFSPGPLTCGHTERRKEWKD